MTKAKECAITVAKWLGKNELNGDVCIYVDHKRYEVNNKGDLVLDLEKAEPEEYFEFVGDKFLAMSFEGPLYNVLNFYDEELIPGYDRKREKQLSDIFGKYGYYYELGDAWNLALSKK